MRMRFPNPDHDTGASPADSVPDSASSTGNTLPRKSTPASRSIALIEGRSILRDCLTRSLSPLSKGEVHAYESVEEWRQSACQTKQSLVILSMCGRDREYELQQVETVLACSAN